MSLIRFNPRMILTLAFATGCWLDAGETTHEMPDGPAVVADSDDEINARLDFPGVTINRNEWYVDVDSVVTMREGPLELIACIKDSKEHESIIAVNAKPSHIHTALLLLNAKPGNPAAKKIIGEGDEQRVIDIPPRGDMVLVFLVVPGEDGPKELPISEFIQKSEHRSDPGSNNQIPVQGPELYPTHQFMFTGSVLAQRGDHETRHYVADFSGNVMSIVTFGDELISTPDIQDDSNDALDWEVRNKHLPELNTPVTLRIRPQPQTKDETTE